MVGLSCLRVRIPSDVCREVPEVWKIGYGGMTSGADWSGRVGESWAEQWPRTDRSFAGLSPHLDSAILAAAPHGTGMAVDLGCGAGGTSIALATARPDLQVVGVDLSPGLVQVAADRGAHLANLHFATADLAVEADRVAAGADLLFSRHGVMFFDNPARIFAALRRTAAPGAGLVFSCFRATALNPWAGALVAAVTGAAPSPPAGYRPGPFGFADAGWVGAMLTEAGWTPALPAPVDYAYVAGEGGDPIADALTFFRRIGPVSSALATATDAERPAMLDRLAAALEPWRTGDRVSMPAAAWLWRARA